ncbi:MAG: hypothetical protein HYZ49_01815 [Chloroflexi bacterium]|nr:hypothetical protein [Chloroflexota bacterium]
MVENWRCVQCGSLNPPRRSKCWQCQTDRPAGTNAQSQPTKISNADTKKDERADPFVLILASAAGQTILYALIAASRINLTAEVLGLLLVYFIIRIVGMAIVVGVLRAFKARPTTELVLVVAITLIPICQAWN